MATQNLVETDDYKRKFDPNTFLSLYYQTPETPENKLRDKIIDSLHTSIQKVSSQLAQQDKLTVLDYGCGPVICNVISAAGLPQVSEIVMSEYTEQNCRMIQQWLDRDPSAFDWSPYFRHVVKTLEGGTEQEVTEREERVRSLIKLAHCDITTDPPIESGYEGPYDMVICFLTLEVSCATIEEYRERAIRLSSLVKPGGTLLLLTTVRNAVGELGTYQVGSETFTDIGLSVGVVSDALRYAQFDILSTSCVGGDENWATDSFNFVLVHADKEPC